MKIVVGGTGLIGSTLVSTLRAKGQRFETWLKYSQPAN